MKVNKYGIVKVYDNDKNIIESIWSGIAAVPRVLHYHHIHNRTYGNGIGINNRGERI